MMPFERKDLATADMTETLDKLVEAKLIDPTSNAFVQFKAAELNDDLTLESTPWFIQLFFGFCGLVISVLLLAAIALMLIALDFGESTALFVTVAIMLSALGYVLLTHASRSSPFVTGLALSLAIGAQGYWLMAIVDNQNSLAFRVAGLMVVELILTVIMPSLFYRLISSTIMLASLLYLLSIFGVTAVSLALLALIFISTTLFSHKLLIMLPPRFLANGISVLRSLSFSSAILLMISAIFFVDLVWDIIDANSAVFQLTDPVMLMLSQGLLALVGIAAAMILAKRYTMPILSLPFLLVMIAIIALGMLSFWASGLLAIALVITISFANGERLLQALSMATLIGYVFWYYYQLDTSLLVKSAALLILAMVCLFLRAVIFSPRFRGGNS